MRMIIIIVFFYCKHAIIIFVGNQLRSVLWICYGLLNSASVLRSVNQSTELRSFYKIICKCSFITCKKRCSSNYLSRSHYCVFMSLVETTRFGQDKYNETLVNYFLAKASLNLEDRSCNKEADEENWETLFNAVYLPGCFGCSLACRLDIALSVF